MNTSNPTKGGIDTSRPTVVEFILDETTSMGSCKTSTIAGYNSFLSDQKMQPGLCLLTLTKFNSDSNNTPFTDVDVSMVVPMTDNMFVPNGMTNLRDTIGERVRLLEERLSSWTIRPNVLVIIMTDGEDNVSKNYSEHQIRDLVKAHEADDWTFAFLGATPQSKQTAVRLGFQPGNVKQFETVDMEETMTVLSTATTSYRSTRVHSASTESSSTYFAG